MGDAHDHGERLTDPELAAEWAGEAAGRTRGGRWQAPRQGRRLSTSEWLDQQKAEVEDALALFDKPEDDR